MPLLALILVAGLAGLAVVALAAVWPEANVAAPAAVEAATSAVGETVAHHRRLRRFVAGRLDPGVMTGLALTAALVAGGRRPESCSRSSRTWCARTRTPHLDNGVARWGNDHAAHGLDSRAERRYATWQRLGRRRRSPYVVAAVESIRAPSRWIIPFLVVALGGEEILTTAVKDLANRARPAFNPVATTLGPSFPSGHSATAAVFYASAGLLLARRRPVLAASTARRPRRRDRGRGRGEPCPPRCPLALRRRRRVSHWAGAGSRSAASRSAAGCSATARPPRRWSRRPMQLPAGRFADSRRPVAR